MMKGGNAVGHVQGYSVATSKDVSMKTGWSLFGACSPASASHGGDTPNTRHIQSAAPFGASRSAVRRMSFPPIVAGLNRSPARIRFLQSRQRNAYDSDNQQPIGSPTHDFTHGYS